MGRVYPAHIKPARTTMSTASPSPTTQPGAATTVVDDTLKLVVAQDSAGDIASLRISGSVNPQNVGAHAAFSAALKELKVELETQQAFPPSAKLTYVGPTADFFDKHENPHDFKLTVDTLTLGQRPTEIVTINADDSGFRVAADSAFLDNMEVGSRVVAAEPMVSTFAKVTARLSPHDSEVCSTRVTRTGKKKWHFEVGFGFDRSPNATMKVGATAVLSMPTASVASVRARTIRRMARRELQRRQVLRSVRFAVARSTAASDE